MNGLIQFLKRHVQDSLSLSMSEEDWGAYALTHPSINRIVTSTSSHQDKDLTPAILGANDFPGEEFVSKRKFEEALDELEPKYTQLALFLVSSARAYGFTLFGMSPTNVGKSSSPVPHKKIVKTQQTAKAKKTRKVRIGRLRFLKGSKRSKINKALRRKGTSLRELIMKEKRGEMKMADVQREIKRLTGHVITVFNLRDLKKRLKIRNKVRYAMKKAAKKVAAKRATKKVMKKTSKKRAKKYFVKNTISLRPGSKMATWSEAFQKKTGKTIPEYYARRRKEGVSPTEISSEIKMAIGVVINTGNFYSRNFGGVVKKSAKAKK